MSWKKWVPLLAGVLHLACEAPAAFGTNAVPNAELFPGARNLWRAPGGYSFCVCDGVVVTQLSRRQQLAAHALLTGELLWRIEDEDSVSSRRWRLGVTARLWCRRNVVILQTDDYVAGLVPETGTVRWWLDDFLRARLDALPDGKLRLIRQTAPVLSRVFAIRVLHETDAVGLLNPITGAVSTQADCGAPCQADAIKPRSPPKSYANVVDDGAWRLTFGALDARRTRLTLRDRVTRRQVYAGYVEGVLESAVLSGRLLVARDVENFIGVFDLDQPLPGLRVQEIFDAELRKRLAVVAQPALYPRPPDFEARAKARAEAVQWIHRAGQEHARSAIIEALDRQPLTHLPQLARLLRGDDATISTAALHRSLRRFRDAPADLATIKALHALLFTRHRMDKRVSQDALNRLEALAVRWLEAHPRELHYGHLSPTEDAQRFRRSLLGFISRIRRHLRARQIAGAGARLERSIDALGPVPICPYYALPPAGAAACEITAPPPWARFDRTRKWAVWKRHVLGSMPEAWAMHLVDGRWRGPWYTGQPGFDDLSELPSLKEAMKRDSDQDGWTDMVEARLLTNPQLADTDGDGIVDPEDRAPRCKQGTPQTGLVSMRRDIVIAVGGYPEVNGPVYVLAREGGCLDFTDLRGPVIELDAAELELLRQQYGEHVVMVHSIGPLQRLNGSVSNEATHEVRHSFRSGRRPSGGGHTLLVRSEGDSWHYVSEGKVFVY